ncbi:MAG: hypothetical protein AVDCRST_MAG89-3090 [uncultured Gemmatimonadetes bacterium]|uniref:Uncharacterized protein n=1 Tax=uncultured Gemmatimonadota bacterium TaxID=203437 RepID=A0A6J4M500_9BACT|nr:MAG: hypothetical protein AVDCRST_MAG89-3090 [uncultured Gemmatimonadota bacterium]
MAINMQGPWTVSVKAKNADWPQRFVILNAATGNGAHNGAPGTAVFVTGTAWSIQVQHNPGGGFVNSDEQIKFPTVSAGQHRFDIQSNDGGNDQDFDDLVLTCSTPQTQNDFIVYGSVSHYSAGCVFNPCFRRPWVIDYRPAFELAVKNPAIRALVERLYPTRLVLPVIPPAGPGPGPEPFRPLVLDPEGGIPAKQSIAVRLQDTHIESPAKGVEPQSVRTVASSRMVDAASQPVTEMASARQQAGSSGRVDLARQIDKLYRRCLSGALPGVVLRFLEYDRTGAELAGGVYTGAGPRETLGVCTTDRNGNYVFRFQRTLSQFFDDADVDTPAGGDEVVHSAPDVIVQVLDPMSPGGVRWESAPYWNVPLRKRINICVPGLSPAAACQGQNAIQKIGSIGIGAPVSPAPVGLPVPTARVGFGNTLNAEGRITTTNSQGPIVQCAAWTGRLDLFACFVDLPVRRYTIRYHRPGDPGWSFYTETLRHDKVANVANPAYAGDIVGPSSAFTVDPEGLPAGAHPSYENIELDADWVLSQRTRKAQIDTGQLVPGAGVLQLWIEGYDAAGVRLAEDAVTLFVDNRLPHMDIASVSMTNGMGGTQSGGDCALFTLPSPNAPLHVRWRAEDDEGSLGAYELTVRRGNAGNIGISGSGGPLSGAYVHGGAQPCTLFHGTGDQPSADADGYVETDVSPAGGGWLPVGVPFCTFSVQVGASTRVTDGYHGGAGYGPVQYLLGIQA